jgi:hypothetical protein
MLPLLGLQLGGRAAVQAGRLVGVLESLLIDLGNSCALFPQKLSGFLQR